MSKSSIFKLSSVRLTPFVSFVYLASFNAYAGSTPVVSVSLHPASAALSVGAKQTFQANVSGSTNQGVTWAVNGIASGSSSAGTINSSGVYTAPAVVSGQSITITATSVADHSKSASAGVSLLNAVPAISNAAAPDGTNKISTGEPFSLAVTGVNFLASTTASLDDGTPATVAVTSATQLTVSGRSASAAGKTVRLTLTNPNDGGKSSNAVSLVVQPQVVLIVSPQKVAVRCLAQQAFTSSIAYTPIKAVAWSVNGVQGGNATTGTVDATGLYTAPAVVPGTTVTITATSMADPTKSSAAVVTLQNAIPTVSSATSPVTAGQSATIMISGNGFAKTATVTLSGIPLNVAWVSSSQLRASGPVTMPVGGYAALVVTNPDPGGSTSNVVAVSVQNGGTQLSYTAAKQFLERATWGPNPASIAHLQSIGIAAWLTEQFDPAVTPESNYSAPLNDNSGIDNLNTQFYLNALNGKDQLRQRMAFALGQIEVVSAVTIHGYYQLMPYQQLLLDDAFGTYHNLLKDVSLSPAMGRFLDMVNNDVATASVSPNENYARELMQLFTVGLSQLNGDGSNTTNPPTPVYTEDDVRALARVLTGWTFPACSGVAEWPNPSCYQGQMVAFENHHDQGQKTVLGTNIQTGSAMGDLQMALSTLESYRSAGSTLPNIAPFVSLRLIQHFVTGNPAPDYVARVANVYESSGGDLKKVITAVLTDQAASSSSGHLREPIFYELSLLRALNVSASSAGTLPSQASAMGQTPFTPESVFSFYSPFYTLPSTGQLAPEFQTLNQQTSLARTNYAYAVLHNNFSPSIKLDLTNFEALASDNNPTTQVSSLTTLLNAASQALLGTPIRSDMASAILPALTSTTDPITRAQTALFLLATAPQYQIQQ